LFGFGVLDVVEALAVELGEPDAVGLVGDVEVQDGPHEREAAFLLHKHHLAAQAA